MPCPLPVGRIEPQTDRVAKRAERTTETSRLFTMQEGSCLNDPVLAIGERVTGRPTGGRETGLLRGRVLIWASMLMRWSAKVMTRAALSGDLPPLPESG